VIIVTDPSPATVPEAGGLEHAATTAAPAAPAASARKLRRERIGCTS